MAKVRLRYRPAMANAACWGTVVRRWGMVFGAVGCAVMSIGFGWLGHGSSMSDDRPLMVSVDWGQMTQTEMVLSSEGLEEQAAQASDDIVYGEPVLETHDYGEAWVYRPVSTRDGRADGVLVIVHGTPGDNEAAIDSARVFLDRWVAFADEHDLVVIAPGFDADRYQRAYGGYRGLFGRDIGADAFVQRLVQLEQERVGRVGEPFLLYGHSAGAQFVCRFVIRHPDRVRAAVMSAPGRYAYPDESAPWPYGMGRFERVLDWGDGHRNREVVEPERSWFVRAATRPVGVVVGARDIEEQPERPGHAATTRVGSAKFWVRDMRAIAREDGEQSRVRLRVVPRVGHNSRELTPACQKMLLALSS